MSLHEHQKIVQIGQKSRSRVNSRLRWWNFSLFGNEHWKDKLEPGFHQKAQFAFCFDIGWALVFFGTKVDASRMVEHEVCLYHDTVQSY